MGGKVWGAQAFLGVREVMQRVWSRPCERVVKYHGRTFEFVPVAVQTGTPTISLAGVKTHEEKIEKAGELVILLDTYQYMLCIATRALTKRRQQKYVELRIGAIGVLTSLHGTLLAFKADPNG